jgi:hypothetical protein
MSITPEWFFCDGFVRHSKSVFGPHQRTCDSERRRDDLPAVVVEGAQEHPPPKAVEALALLIVGIVPASGCGVVERVASPYTGLMILAGG